MHGLPPPQTLLQLPHAEMLSADEISGLDLAR
jgi:hypothetical protein